MAVLLNAGVFRGDCRKLYWSDQGTDSGVPAKVASANMDGTSLKTLFTGNLEHLEIVTLDIKEQKLYWAVTSRGVVRAPCGLHY
jgi:low density lipoprotein-related protein 2